MPSRARLFPLCTVWLAIALSGCASDRLADTAPAGVRLGGNWALDPAASDDTGRVVERLQAQIDRALHPRRRNAPAGEYAAARRRGPGQPGDSGEASESAERTRPSAPARPAGGPRAAAALVQEFLANVPGSYLSITVAPGSFNVVSENASQQYAPGVQTAVELGQFSAEQICGWKDRKFVIDTRPQLGPALTQSYGLAPDGKLVVTVRLDGAGINAAVTLRYERTRQTPAAVLPTSD